MKETRVKEEEMCERVTQRASDVEPELNRRKGIVVTSDGEIVHEDDRLLHCEISQEKTIRN
jgi:hypothetical protein